MRSRIAKSLEGASEDQCTAELQLLDRYLAFSTEVVRLALLGIAVFGFLLRENVGSLADEPANAPGYGLFSGCAGRDTAMAVVLKVG